MEWYRPVCAQNEHRASGGVVVNPIFKPARIKLFSAGTNHAKARVQTLAWGRVQKQPGELSPALKSCAAVDCVAQRRNLHPRRKAEDGIPEQTRLSAHGTQLVGCTQERQHLAFRHSGTPYFD